MTRTALVIGHHPGDHAGNFLAPLRDFGFRVATWIPSEGEAPPVADADALVVLGGVMGANDEAEHPWMTGEFRLIERYMADEKPVLGVCLGSQILARLLGARVYKAEALELGYRRIAPVEPSPLLAPFAANEWRVMQWHYDAFDLPAGARRLAENAHTPNQAFEYGENLFAVQFHPEVSRETLGVWMEKGGAALEKAGFDPGAVLDEAARWGEGMERAGAEMMAAFLARRFERPEVALDMKLQA